MCTKEIASDPDPHSLVSFNLFNFSIFFLTSLLEYNCFTVVCQFLLYNKVNQLYIYIYPHVSSLLRLPPTLPIPPLYVVTKHRADLPVLCGCFPLAIYFTFGSICKSMPLSHFVPACFEEIILWLFSYFDNRLSCQLSIIHKKPFYHKRVPIFLKVYSDGL